jgi:hypothetical protein
MNGVTELAIQAIGSTSEATDWELNPARHAASLPDLAGPLKRILMTDEVQNVVSNYRSDDLSAAAYQQAHRRLAKFHTFARYIEAGARPIAIVIAVLFLLPYQRFFSFNDLTAIAENREISHIAFIVELVALLMLLLFTGAQLRARSLQRWIEHRTRAERLRYELFLKVMNADETVREGEIPILPLKLEYFRRFNLGVQFAYLSVRAKASAYRRGPSPTMWLLLVVLFLAAWLAVWLGAITGKLHLNPFLVERSFFLVGGIAALVVGTRKAATEYDAELRQRIEATNLIDNLAFLQERFLNEARQAAASGNAEGVNQFVRLVQGQVFRDTARLRDFDY